MKKKYFKFCSTYQEVSDINLLIKDFHFINKLSEADICELEIVLMEAMNNIVKHSYNENPAGIIEIDLEIRNNFWQCRLMDYGESRKNLEIPKLEFDPADIQNLPESGMGLFLINKLTDSNEYKIFDTYNEFLLKKRLRF